MQAPSSGKASQLPEGLRRTLGHWALSVDWGLTYAYEYTHTYTHTYTAYTYTYTDVVADIDVDIAASVNWGSFYPLFFKGVEVDIRQVWSLELILTRTTIMTVSLGSISWVSF